MQIVFDKPISRRRFLSVAGTGIAGMLRVGCTAETYPMSLIGAYRPLTGQDDPKDYWTDTEDIAAAIQKA